MATTLISLDRLQQYNGLIKTYIDTADAKSIKRITYDSTTLEVKFFKTETATQGETPYFTVTLPATSDFVTKLTSGTYTAGDFLVASATGGIESAGASIAASKIDYSQTQTLDNYLGTIPSGATATNVIDYAEEVAASEASDAVDAVSGSATIASKTGNAVTLKAGITQTQSVVANNSDADITLADVAVTGDASDVTYSNTTSGLAATDVQAAIDEVAAQSAGGVSSKTVYMKDETQAGGAYAATYTFYQGSDATDMTKNTLVGTINLAKELVVQSGSVVTVTSGVDSEGDNTSVADGTYVKLRIQNQTAPIYINVADLVDVYTGGTTAEATVAIDSSNEITVTIGKVNGTKVIYQEADATQGIAEVTMTAKVDAVESYVGTIPQTASAATVVDYVDEKVTASIPGTATETQTAGADGLALSVTTAGGIVTAVSGSIAANTYDAYGAATAAVQALDSTTDDTGVTGTAGSSMDVLTNLTIADGKFSAKTYTTLGSAALQADTYFMKSADYTIATSAEIEAMFT